MLSSDNSEMASPDTVVDSEKTDILSVRLLCLVRFLMVGLVGLLPCFFWPDLGAIGFQKSLLSLTVITLVATCLGLMLVRPQALRTIVPLPTVFFAVFVAMTGLAAFFSADPLVGWRGSQLEVGTVAFSGLLLGMMLLPLVLQGSKVYSLITLLSGLMGILFLLLYVVAHILLGWSLNYESQSAVLAGPISNVTDLLILSLLGWLAGTLLLVQSTTRSWLRFLGVGLVGLSLLTLAVVAMREAWIVVGVGSLLVLLYILSHHSQSSPGNTKFLLIGTTAVGCLLSAWFVVVGPSVESTWLSNLGVEKTVVRPSVAHTLSIAEQVYRTDDWLWGVGPNQFVTAWRQYKLPSVNTTPLWHADFTQGSSYVSTLVVTTGPLAFLAFIIFFFSYIWFGVRLLYFKRTLDRDWYLLGTKAFAVAMFLWLLAWIFVVSHVWLLLAAVFTGLSLVARATPSSKSLLNIALAKPAERSWSRLVLAMVIIVSPVVCLVALTKQYWAQTSFVQAQLVSDDLRTLDQEADFSYSLYPDSRFLSTRAQLIILELNSMLDTPSLTAVEQEQFSLLTRQALNFIEQAINSSPNNPDNYVLRASVYNILAVAGVAGALDEVVSSLQTAVDLDPLDPVYAVVGAQMAVRRGDVEGAKHHLKTALLQKPDFKEALDLRAQIEIATEDTAAAITTTEFLLALDPTSVAYYYQLGILQATSGNFIFARQAYDRALQLDPQHANARYQRALVHAELGNIEVALAELRLLQESNSDDTTLLESINQLEAESRIIKTARSVEVSKDTGTTTATSTAPAQGLENVTAEEVVPIEVEESI